MSYLLFCFILYIVKQQNTLFILFVYPDQSFVAKYSLKTDVILIFFI